MESNVFPPRPLVMASTDFADAHIAEEDTGDDHRTSAKTEQTAIELMTNLQGKLDALAVELNDLRKFSKVVSRQVAKTSKRKVRRSPGDGSKPSGFAFPVRILPKLTLFLNEIRRTNNETVEKTGECVPRTIVTRLITNYIKSNDLQKAENRRVFKLDNGLAALFDRNVGDELTWFQLQSVLADLYDRSDEAKVENARQKKLIADAATVQAPVTHDDPAPDAVAPPKAKRPKKAVVPAMLEDAVAEADAVAAKKKK